MKNSVAKYAHRFNKSAVFLDRKKEAKKRGYEDDRESYRKERNYRG